MVFQGFRASEKPRCDCGGFLPESREPGLNRIKCAKCGKWNMEYSNPNRNAAD